MKSCAGASARTSSGHISNKGCQTRNPCAKLREISWFLKRGFHAQSFLRHPFARCQRLHVYLLPLRPVRDVHDLGQHAPNLRRSESAKLRELHERIAGRSARSNAANPLRAQRHYYGAGTGIASTVVRYRFDQTTVLTRALVAVPPVQTVQAGL